MKLKCFFARGARLLLPAFFALWQESSARTEEYYVSGMVEVDISEFKRDEVFLGGHTYKATFEISVRDGLWLLRTQRKDEADYVEYGTDGKDLFELQPFANSYDQKAGQQLNDASGTIEHDWMPLSFFRPHVAVLWFAYASSRYLNGVENGQLRPVFYADVGASPLHRRDFKVNAQLKRFTEDPQLPQEAIVLDDGKERSFGRQDRYALSDPMIATRPRPYDAGFTNGVFAFYPRRTSVTCEYPPACFTTTICPFQMEHRIQRRIAMRRLPSTLR